MKLFTKPFLGLQFSAGFTSVGVMVGRIHPDLSEVAYHIISLCDYGRRSDSGLQKKNVVRAIGAMIGISLGVQNTDAIAHAVIQELDVIRDGRNQREVEPDGIEVVFIASLLHEQLDETRAPAATAYWASVFD